MPTGQRSEIESQLKMLPKSFTTADISRMYDDLRADIEKLKSSGVAQAKMEQILHAKHKTLAFAYPTFFFKVVKGEMSEFMFRKCMEIKQDMDQGKISADQAKNLVVDHAKLHVEGAAPRPSRPEKIQPGASVQEIVVQAQVDDNSELRVVRDEVN